MDVDYRMNGYKDMQIFLASIMNETKIYRID